MSCDWLQMQDLFLHETKSECTDVVENTWLMTTLSNQVAKTIILTNIPLLLFQEEVSLGSYF